MTLRMCEPMTSGMVAIGDSDFGSLQSAYGLAKENKGCIFNVKTAHSMLPKKQIEEQLKGCAAGSSVVWTTEIDGIRFNCIGYKYARSKKLQMFITTVGEVTCDWKPYIAKFKDSHGKTISRAIPRPKVLSVAYTLLNRVDVHNQGRQDLIRLERTWETRNCWFRNLCFGLGVIAENAWRHNHNSVASNKTQSHDEFIRKLANQLALVTTITAKDGTVIERKSNKRKENASLVVTIRSPGMVLASGSERKLR